jgi:predicted GH43/DUF377 family glycosyl hydrolase
VEWVREGTALTPGRSGEPDAARMSRPWVLEDNGGGWRMWYSGHDGTTGRILTAVQRPGAEWMRQGVAIDAGFAGDSDRYGVESPSVVHTPGGYLMAYAGFDGDAVRLHMATSADGRAWTPRGPIMQPGEQDALGASHPCLLSTEAGWWLFFSGYDGSRDSRRSVILAAVSPSDASWERVGAVLEPAEGELATSHPCVLVISRTFYMFYGSDTGDRVDIAMATSTDGLSWNRHGITLQATGEGAEARGVHAPCAVRCNDGSIRMWYAGLGSGDTSLAYQICSARFPGPWSTGV